MLYDDIKLKCKEGDKVLTKVDWSGVERVITYTKGAVKVEGHTFAWDFFFEVNTPIKIVE